MSSKRLFLLVSVMLLFGNVSGQCSASFWQTGCYNNVLTVQAALYSNVTYVWQVTGPGCSSSGNGSPNIRNVYIPNGSQATISLNIYDNTGGACSGSFSNWGYTTINVIPIVGSSTVCGPDPVPYSSEYWDSQLPGPWGIGFEWTVTNGTIVRRMRNYPYVGLPSMRADTVWVSWGAGALGTIENNYSNQHPPGCYSHKIKHVLTRCGVTGPRVCCTGVRNGYRMGCPPGSTYQWSVSNGTILFGQGTDSISVNWANPGLDTIVIISNSPNCGLDTSFVPIEILATPTNLIFGDTVACQGTLDTFSTSVLPLLSFLIVSKEWNATGGGLMVNVPSANQLSYVHGAGPFETIKLTTIDHGCIFEDTLQVRINPQPVMTLGPSPLICNGDSALLDPGLGFASYTWSNGSTTQTIYADTSISYAVTVTNSPYNCATSSSVTPILDLDCVWPGDANHDYMTDLNDFLAIGVAFGATGGIRTNASSNWTGQPAANWAQAFGNGVNYKHADCDGDGLVHFSDTMSVTIHQGLTHARVAGVSAGIPLRITPLQPTYAGTDTIELKVQLGNLGVPADSSYGLVFSLAFSPTDILPGSITCSISQSILGVPGQHIMSLQRDSSSNGDYWVGIVRIDHLPSYGYGDICRIKLRASPSIWTGMQMAQLPIFLDHCRLVKPDGTDLPVLCSAGMVRVYDQNWVSLTQATGSFFWNISPNPADDEVRIALDARLYGDYRIEVLDLSGKILQVETGILGQGSEPSEVRLRTNAIPVGAYFVRVTVDGWHSTKRFVILRK